MKVAQEGCEENHKNFTYLPDITYCNAVFDNTLCWPPTPAGENATQNCPDEPTSDPSNFAYRTCNHDGKWDTANETNMKHPENGYTNYMDCFLPHIRKNILWCKRVIGMDACDIIQHNTRMIEMIGYSISLLAVMISLFIFFRYRVLRNNRTRIHKNLFISTALHVIIRLVIYIDQTYGTHQIFKTPILYKTMYILLEYAKTAMFIWMFIEGLYLHNVITVTVFQEYSYMKFYIWVGWTFPLALNIVWIIVMVTCTEKFRRFYMYFDLPYYWVLDGPRFALIIINLVFLLNIIRVLVVKLRETHTSEIQQVRKAVRAAIFLLPLMGIAHISYMTDYTKFTTLWKAELWSYASHILTTFQGLYISLLYCFFNGEVQAALKNSFFVYRALRKDNSARGNSIHFSAVTSLETEP